MFVLRISDDKETERIVSLKLISYIVYVTLITFKIINNSRKPRLKKGSFTEESRFFRNCFEKSPTYLYLYLPT